MARKNLLRELMAEPAAEEPGDGRPEATPVEAPVDAPVGLPLPAPEVDSRQPDPAKPRGPRGAIGAVGRSIADLKARALLDLDPGLIDAGGLADRLGPDEAEDARLMASLRDHGQQVPVLVRPHPEAEGRYQIVYGRRRLRALRDLGLPVRAMVRALDDAALVLAQGQENSARRDLSFIEKAGFARAMIEAGYDRETAGAALTVDKTALSRMLSVTARIPAEVIASVGAAPGVGRDRWLALAEAYAAASPDPEAARAGIAAASGPESDQRFVALEGWLRRRGKRAPVPAAEAPPREGAEILRGPRGERLAEVTRARGGLELSLGRKGLGGFDEWLVANLADLYAAWRSRHDG